MFVLISKCYTILLENFSYWHCSNEQIAYNNISYLYSS